MRDELGYHAEEVAARFHRKAILSMQEVEGRLAVQIGDTQQAGGCGAHCKCLLSTSQKLDEVRRLAEATSDDQRLADRHRDSAWKAVQQAKGAVAQAQSVAQQARSSSVDAQKYLGEVQEAHRTLENTRIQNQQVLARMEECLANQRAETERQQALAARVAESQRLVRIDLAEIDGALTAVRAQVEQANRLRGQVAEMAMGSNTQQGRIDPTAASAARGELIQMLRDVEQADIDRHLKRDR